MHTGLPFLAGRFFCESIAISLRLCYNIGNYKRKYALLQKNADPGHFD